MSGFPEYIPPITITPLRRLTGESGDVMQNILAAHSLETVQLLLPVLSSLLIVFPTTSS